MELAVIAITEMRAADDCVEPISAARDGGRSSVAGSVGRWR
jgi:hypothetical protein